MRFFIIFFISVLITSVGAKQQKPCTAPEARQFDFWIGEWIATWSDTAYGTNSISKILGGCVISEQFNGSPASPLVGRSFSVYNSRTGNWQQTWVDNQGAYLEFSGGWQDNKMILSREVNLNGKNIIQRMIWYNINKNEFDWDWQRSDDNGNTWKTNWQIHYRRK
ncbi:MAG: DUF1579 family protein [Calditrichae bacterium]|nr:DUF1579 family protein [Calditrichota bacterium]MCB9059346.1 DUF1579 family protein [Calditrichia bacterium]